MGGLMISAMESVASTSQLSSKELYCVFIEQLFHTNESLHATQRRSSVLQILLQLDSYLIT